MLSLSVSRFVLAVMVPIGGLHGSKHSWIYFHLCYLSVSYLFFQEKPLPGVLFSFPSKKNKLNLTLFFNFPDHSSTKMYCRWCFPVTANLSPWCAILWGMPDPRQQRGNIRWGFSWLHGRRHLSPVRFTWLRAYLALRAQALLCCYSGLEIYNRSLLIWASGTSEVGLDNMYGSFLLHNSPIT